MKTKIFTLLLLAIPFFINAQALNVASGATVTVGGGASMTTGNVAITNSPTTGKITIEPGGVMVAGQVINTDTAGLIIKSNATHQGTFIFDDNGSDPKATVQIYVPKGSWDPSPAPYGTVNHWHFVSPPITNATAQDFFYDDTHDAWLLKYLPNVPQTDAWDAIVALTTQLPSGTGYSYVWMDNSSRENDGGTVTFTGPITADEIDITFNYNGAPDESFHLVGNPYTATIQLHTTPAGIENSYWIWDGANNNYLYGTQHGGTGYPAPGTLDNHVAMGQAFFVRATGNPDQVDEKFLANMRLHAAKPFYKKNSNGDDYANHIMLLASKGEYKDRMFVTFAEDGTEDFENGYDITKLFGGATSPQLYMNVQDRQQSINYIASLTETEERIVPFGFRAGEDGEQKFEFTTQYLIDATVSLEDTKTGETINLMDTPVYTFTATPGDNENRFLLHFNWSPTGIEDPITSTENAMGIYAYDKAVYISNKDNNFNQTSTITIHDMYGRMVYSDKAILIGTTRIPLQVNNTYLVVRVRNANGVYTSKVFIK